MYRDGDGVPQNDAEAERFFRLAADQGHASGQNILGVMYVDGRGVPQDYVLAHMWFNLAAAGSNGDRHINNRDRAAGELTPDDLSEAKRLAHEWDAAHPREP